MPVSVVIPTYGRDLTLVKTIQHVLALVGDADEVIVVDQTSRHDEASESTLIRLAAQNLICWIRLPEPSIPKAMNRGLLLANNPIVLFLDDDIIPDADLINAHLVNHQEHPGAIIAGRVLQPWHDGKPDSAGSDFRFNSLEGRNVEEFMGGNFSVDRQSALDLGGFDENFVRVAYRFEADFAYRWLASGRKIRYCPEALIHHLKVASGGTRKFGEHLTTIKPSHSVGAYYFAMKTLGYRSIGSVCSRLISSIVTRHHLRKPWWIPVTLLSELQGLVWAVFLQVRGPRYVKSDVCPRASSPTE